MHVFFSLFLAGVFFLVWGKGGGRGVCVSFLRFLCCTPAATSDLPQKIPSYLLFEITSHPIHYPPLPKVTQKTFITDRRRRPTLLYLQKQANNNRKTQWEEGKGLSIILFRIRPALSLSPSIRQGRKETREREGP